MIFGGLPTVLVGMSLAFAGGIVFVDHAFNNVTKSSMRLDFAIVLDGFVSQYSDGDFALMYNG